VASSPVQYDRMSSNSRTAGFERIVVGSLFKWR
jgi:hypothetical protein